MVKYRDGIKNKKIDRKYIEIGYGCIVINYNNIATAYDIIACGLCTRTRTQRLWGVCTQKHQ